MAIQRVTPSEYFGNIPQYTLQETGTNHTGLIIFGAICVVAVAAMVIAYLKK